MPTPSALTGADGASFGVNRGDEAGLAVLLAPVPHRSGSLVGVVVVVRDLAVLVCHLGTLRLADGSKGVTRPHIRSVDLAAVYCTGRAHFG